MKDIIATIQQKLLVFLVYCCFYNFCLPLCENVVSNSINILHFDFGAEVKQFQVLCKFQTSEHTKCVSVNGNGRRQGKTLYSHMLHMCLHFWLSVYVCVCKCEFVDKIYWTYFRFFSLSPSLSLTLNITAFFGVSEVEKFLLAF